MKESERLIRGVGDANPERTYTVSVTVTETQRTATCQFLQSARQQLANSILAPHCSPAEEEVKTRALAVIARLAGALKTAVEVKGTAVSQRKRAG